MKKSFIFKYCCG